MRGVPPADAPADAGLSFGEPVRSDWNVRYPVRLADGAWVEAVVYRDDTLCLSTQVGCGVRCVFCASGRDGLGRSLRIDELQGQVDAARVRGHALRRLTLSGVGEPLHNADVVLEFLARTHAAGLPASVTTSGGTPTRLEALLRAPHNGVTVSLHAGTEATRARLVPHGPSLDAVFGTVASVLPSLTRAKRKKVAFAHLLVAGENDGEAELDALADRLAPLGQPLHLYALNPVEGLGARRASREAYEAAYGRLRARGLVVRMSSQARIDANGGCGTLVAARRLAAGRAGAPS